MDLQLLGPIEARLGDRSVVLGARKQRAVLAMLGLEANRTVSAGRLAEGLWGEEPPASAPKMVQLYVSQLRRLLDGNGATIVTHGRDYELRIPSDAVDVARFERLVDESRPREALALWRGDALADVADAPFAALEIRRLDEQRVHAHELAIDADLDAGRHDDVIGELEALVAEHPLRERLHAQRMLALYRSGRQSEALDAYQQARGALVEQVGVEPGAELQRLQDAILTHDHDIDLPAPAPPARPPPPSEPSPAPARPPPRRSLHPLVALALLSAAAGLLVFGITRVTAPDRLPRIDENHVGAIDPDGGRITDQFAVGRGPAAVAAGAGSIWVADALDGTVSRIDRDSDPVTVRKFEVGGEPTALAFAAGSLWVANGESRTVAQIDPGTNRVTHPLHVGNASRGIAAAGDSLWVTSAIDGAVRRIDLDHATVSRPIPVGANPTAIAAGADAIWVASEEAGTITRLDPRTREVAKVISVGNGPSAVAVGAGAVWVVNRSDGTVSRIDPRTNTVTEVVSVGPDPTAIAAGDAGVWVAGGSAGTVTRIDRDAPRVDVESNASAVAVADGKVWTSAVAPPESHRGGTLRVIAFVDKPVSAAIDWLHRDAYIAQSNQLISLAYDGLVAYRRVAGAPGATLVGALAIDVPRPSPDGLTYVFTLRPGLRYSDGTPVRPEDFRASIERFLQVTQRKPFTADFYGGIVGAERCMMRAGRCDLSAGIETDTRARTITVHLTRPDAEFLHKLTFQFANVVPADTPRRRIGDRAPPGTGPYRFAAWDRYRGGHLVRNPHFRSWSERDRPAGFAERIEVAVRDNVKGERLDTRKVAAQVAAVQRGTADVVVLANAFGSLYSPERLRGLEVSSPGQLHRHPEPVLNHMFLNVRRPPFDDVDVRRALNYATDRARIVELEGGPELATATCQILPVGFPGYRPYCPYTASPGSGGAWSAPDMDRARALVAGSGTRGERVEVTMPEFQRDVGRYFAGLLRRLGYRASLRVIVGDPYWIRLDDPKTRVQMGFMGWSSDYLSPSTFVEPNFGCLEILSRLCDRPLMRQIELAHEAQGDDAARRWAAIDRRVTDLAPAVPLTNRRSAELVSARVGNVQHHLAGIILLDRLWVR
jgi:YVTN family beta-propeller protein